MIRSKLIDKLIEENPHLYKRDVERLVSAFFDEIGNALTAGGRVEIRGFGVFSVKERGARIGRNPRTGEPVGIESKRAPHFKAGKELRMRLNDGYRDQ